MKRIGFTFRIREDKIDEYKEFHKHVWPEMKEALTRHGWHHYTLFLKPDGTVFGYFETPVDLATASDGMKLEEINERWQKTMSQFVPDGMKPDDSFVELEEYFHLE
ncbi:MAG: L-rhamnose mutarotase [Anaerolineae bacterium]|nr:L-rhamnose mutarotase [Anaerolineae bacterium]